MVEVKEQAPSLAVALFYKYVEVPDPDATATVQHALCTGLGLTGRIRLAAEGINGLLAGTPDAVAECAISTDVLSNYRRFTLCTVFRWFGAPNDCQSTPPACSLSGLVFCTRVVTAVSFKLLSALFITPVS
jgi:hypothetical protein